MRKNVVTVLSVFALLSLTSFSGVLARDCHAQPAFASPSVSLSPFACLIVRSWLKEFESGSYYKDFKGCGGSAEVQKELDALKLVCDQTEKVSVDLGMGVTKTAICKTIPSDDFDKEKRELELLGNVKVVGKSDVSEHPGWSNLYWVYTDDVEDIVRSLQLRVPLKAQQEDN